MNRTAKMVASSALIAFGIILPLVFHFAGALGPVFLPMHIPVLIAGLFLGRFSGFIVGVLTPVLSSLLTGMPPFSVPVLPVMVAELAVYGLVSGYLYKDKQINLLVSLLVSMAIGRLAAAVAVCFMATVFHITLSPLVYLTGAVITGLPGLAVQIILVPLLVKRLQGVFAR